MKILNRESKHFEIETPYYRLKVQGEQVLLTFTSGHELRLAIPSALCCKDKRDINLGLEPLEVLERKDRIELTFQGNSSIWEEKAYTWILKDETIEFFLAVKGEGSLTRLLLLGSMPDPDLEPAIRWVDFLEEGIASTGNFQRIFLPQPTGKEKHFFKPSARIRHSVDYHPEFYDGGHFFTPAPFCYPLEKDEKWLGVTLAAKPGEYRFPNFDFWGGEHFCFCVDYEGYWSIDGEWESPHLIIHAKAAGDPYETVTNSNQYLFKSGWIQEPKKKVESWWQRPLFCGWGEQCYLHHLGEYEGRPSKDPEQTFSSQSNYESFVEHLESKGLNPGSVIIDDRWMVFWGRPEAHPGRWRNMRGFVEGQHQKGRHVLLWLPMWELDGIPSNHCVQRGGLPLKVDPTNPGYITELKRCIGRMLGSGPEDYNADGFKIDFTANIPSGPGCELYESIWGVELLYRLLRMVYDFAKAIKPDALIITHTPHPYFASCTDMLRLNDMVVTKHSVASELTHRAKVAHSVHPDLLIDTDNWPSTNHSVWQEYVKLQPQLGVPSLYYATHVGRRTPLEDSDYQMLKKLWSDYEKKVKR